MMSSPLDDFISRLLEGSTMSANVAVVSDNAGTRVVACTICSPERVRQSRWEPEKEKSQLSPKVPSRLPFLSTRTASREERLPPPAAA
jgi:hypothetical protein